MLVQPLTRPSRSSQLTELLEHQTEATVPQPLEADEEPPKPRYRLRGLNLFWRTFFLIALLLVGSILAWLQTWRVLEDEPRAKQTAQQLASLVNLSRAALVHSDGIARISLIKTLSDQEGVRIVLRESSDAVEPLARNAHLADIERALRERLGAGTLLRTSVNGERGMWVGFSIEEDLYWLHTDPMRVGPVVGQTWLIWLLVAGALSIAGAAVIARLINQPLKLLSFAASRVREGDFGASVLNEHIMTSEIREVNVGFNRMAQQLANAEQDRVLMLAGISHDLRTPLARLRLETEMSVADKQAQAHMVSDIEQLDAIIDKFLEYARPETTPLQAVSLNEVVNSAIYPFTGRDDMRITVELPPHMLALGDEVELGRVMANLLENARKYGKTADTGIANVEIAGRWREGRVLIKVRDHGQGVSSEMLGKLTQPFYRGNAARTAATGAGLGLAIVERTVARMGGTFILANTRSGGLAAQISLAPAKKP